MASVENLVMESLQFKYTQASRKWKIVAAMACVVAIVMTGLFIWQVLKDDEQSDSFCNGKNRPKEEASRTNPEQFGRPCPHQPARLPPIVDPIPEQLSNALKKIGDYVDSVVDADAQLPAISVNVFYQNRTLLQNRHYGSKRYKGENKPDDQTVYRIGSITKVFVVLMVYKFYEDGLIKSLDDPLSKYAPEFCIQNPYTKENVTVRQIASQMSGLPREAPCFYICENVTSADQLQQLKNRSLVMAPGTMPSYSNLGYALLGRLLTENLLTNQTFESWVRERILKPLNMTNTGFEITEDAQQNMAFPHSKDGSRMPFMIIYWVAPAGQMYSTLEDMTKLGKMFTQPSKQTLFRPSTLWEMMSPGNVAPDGITVWGAPWEMEQLEHFLVRGKGGVIDSYATFFSVVPELELGINLLMSSTSFLNGVGSGPPASRMTHEIYKMLLPVLNQTLFDLEGSSSFPVDAKPYVGNYTLNITDPLTSEIITKSVRLTVKDDALAVYYFNTTKAAFHVFYIGDKFVFQARFASPFASCLIERLGSYEDVHFFSFDEKGFSTGFKVPGRGMLATRIF